MADRPLMGYSLTLLNIGGLVTYKNNVWGKLRKFVLITSLVILYLDVQIRVVLDWGATDSTENAFSSIGVFQIILKTLVFNSEYVLTTVAKMNKFYPLNKYGLAQETINRKIFAKIRLFFLNYYVFFIMIIGVFCGRTFLYTPKKLPFGSILFASEKYYLFEIGFAYQSMVMIFLIPIQLGFDFTYISLIANLVCEFKLLKAGFSQIPINEESQTDERTLRVLGNLIVHHNVILDCSEALRRVYYIPFLIIFLFNMIGIGNCLMCIVANGIFQNIAISGVYGMVILFYSMQLFIYCAPGTLLISESIGVSDIVFGTDWCIKPQPKLRRAYIRVLQRAHKPVLLSAGGMMDVTLETFTSIMNSALSFFTCAQAMYEKS